MSADPTVLAALLTLYALASLGEWLQNRRAAQ